MEDLYKDFITGEEVKTIKGFLKSMNAFVIAGTVLGYLVLLDTLPRFTIVVTALAVGSLFLTHFIKKWTKQ